MKVVFLDVDGVLNSDEYFDKIQEMNVEGIEKEIDVNTIKLLKKGIEETDARVVLSSSWRNTKNGQELKQLLASYQIVVDSTPFIDNVRGIEIKEYLKEHKDIEDFVILDDEIFDSYDEELMKKLIKISDGNGINFGEGLQEKDVKEIIQRLGRKRQIDREELEI